jgi:hypothetical protein
MTKYSIVGIAAFLGLGLVLGCGDHDRTENSDAGLGGTTGAADDAGDADAGESTTGDEAADADADAGADESSTGAPEPADDGSGDAPAEPTCEQGSFTVSVEPGTPRVMLVLDKSRSMTNFWDHDADPTTPEISRWHSLHNVVAELTTQFSGTVEFGAQLFPSAEAWLDEPTNAFSCDVREAPEVGVGPDTAAAILQAIPAAEDLTISGGTPATAGIQSAASHLMEMPGEDPRAIVLVTDGAANCNPGEAPEDTLFVYDAALPTSVAHAYGTMSIPVYVVGINILDEMGTKPAVNAYEALSEVAVAGGAPSDGPDTFYNAFNELELVDALETVAGQIECTLPLQEEPEHPDLVQITIDGATFSQTADCDAGNGWVYTSPAGPLNAVRLCGTACDMLQDGGGTVEIEYLCP